jgi:hypothetical protein
MIAGGVELNKNLETAERVFSAAFGSPELGKETIKFLDEIAEKLNIDKNLALQFGQSILPKTDSLESFTDLLRLTDIQADTTGKTVDELSFAIREALSGDFVSLKDQFDISKEQVDQIKALTPELGASGALAKVLGEEFERLGKINIQDTLATDIKAIQTQFTDLQKALGEPLFEELKEQAAAFGEFLAENEDDLTLIAQQIGAIIADIGEFTGDNLLGFLESLDPAEIQDFLLAVQNLVTQAETAISLFSDWGGSASNLFSILNPFSSLLDNFNKILAPTGQQITGVVDGVNKLGYAFDTLSKIVALGKAGFAQLSVTLSESSQGFILAGQALEAGLAGNLVEAANLAQQAGDKFETAFAKGQEAFNESLIESATAIEESNQKIQENVQAQEDRKAAL